MLTRGAKRKARKRKANDRHYDKGDQHKKKGGVDHHANKDSGHKFICGYDKCGEVIASVDLQKEHYSQHAFEVPSSS